MARKKRKIDGEDSVKSSHEEGKILAETPIRALESVQVDTEGRRARFGSPPPPPGASPSLLIPTPGRDVTNTAMLSGIYPHQDQDYCELLQPLKAPIFQVDEELESSASTNDTIKLLHWCFKLVPIKQPILLNSTTSTLSHWIIVCGIRSSQSKDAESKGAQDISCEELWHSSCIVERKGPRVISTASGSAYELIGPCNNNLSKEKLSSGYCKLFDHFVPGDWIDAVSAEATGRGMLRTSSDLNSGKYRKMVRAAKKRESEDIFRDFSPIDSSPPRIVKNDKKTPVSPDNAMDVAKRAIKLSQKSIPRELRQLQSSTLGDLAMVQAAIIEGLETKEPVKKKVLLEPEPLDILTEEKDRKVNAVTPLRTSTRARNTVSEWWKVDTKSSGKVKSIQRKIEPPEIKKVDKSKVSNVDVMDSEEGSSEDEYQMSGSSSDVDGMKSKDKRLSSRNDRIQPLTNGIVKQKKARKKSASISEDKAKSKSVPAKQARPIDQFFIRSSPTNKTADNETNRDQKRPSSDPQVASLPLTLTTSAMTPSITEPIPAEHTLNLNSGVDAASVENEEAETVDIVAPIQQEPSLQSVQLSYTSNFDDTFYFSD